MRALKGLVLAGAITPLLGACVIYDSSAHEAVTVRVANGNTSVAVAAPLETLRSVRFEPGALVVQADSGGCTREASFAVRITDGDGPAQVSLTRETPDNCEAHLANGVELRWTYEELGLASGQAAVIQNPVRLP
jgi:hypothetical protein